MVRLPVTVSTESWLAVEHKQALPKVGLGQQQKVFRTAFRKPTTKKSNKQTRIGNNNSQQLTSMHNNIIQTIRTHGLTRSMSTDR